MSYYPGGPPPPQGSPYQRQQQPSSHGHHQHVHPYYPQQSYQQHAPLSQDWHWDPRSQNAYAGGIPPGPSYYNGPSALPAFNDPYAHPQHGNGSYGQPYYARAPLPGRSSKSPEWNGVRRSDLAHGPRHSHDRPRHEQDVRLAADNGSYRPPASRDRPIRATNRRTVPRDEYLADTLAPSTRLTPAAAEAKKLILLDLNGSLVFRASKQKADSYRRRPFVTNFIEYLRQHWEVGVWSSAQPHSVEKMVHSIGLKTRKAKPAEPIAEKAEAVSAPAIEAANVEATEEADDSKDLTLKLLWARDTFGLTPSEYNQRTETIKDLDSIWKHLNSEEPGRLQPYGASNTLLLDDSYTKTSCQPFNHLPVPDFGQSIAYESARAYRAALAFQQHGEGMHAELVPDREKRIDRSLLGIIGILERARGEANVAGWIRAGGLVPDLGDPNGWWLEKDVEGDAMPVTSSDLGKKDFKKPKKSKLRKTVGSDALNALIFPSATDPPPRQPSAAELSPMAKPPVPWFASPAHADFWTRRGVDALLGLGIELDFSMTIDFLPLTREEIDANRAKREELDQQRLQEQASADGGGGRATGATGGAVGTRP